MGTTIKANIISGNTIKANVEAGGNIRVNAVTGSVKSTSLPDVVIKAFIKDQGPIGPKGDTGPANSLDIGTVESGITPSATITGTAPTQTLNLTLPKGDKGDKGETGVGITEETVGFTLTGGTTPKTLTVPLDATISGTNTGDNSTNTSCIAKTTNITALNETGIADDEIAVFNLTNKDIRTSNKTIVTTLGSDDTTVPTSKAVKDNIPVKVVGSEVDTGTDDAKFLTAKSINDSHNIPLVTPSTSGNLMTSNGTDWISSTPPVSVSVTTKGDIQTYSTTPDRLPVGSDGYILRAKSSATNGIEWTPQYSSIYRQALFNPACEVYQLAAAVNLTSGKLFGGSDGFYAKGAGTAVSAGTIIQSTTANCGKSGYADKLSGVTLTGAGKVHAYRFIESINAKLYKNQAASFGVVVYHDVGSAINYVVKINKANSADNFSAVTNIATASAQSVPNTTETRIVFENINSGDLGDCSNGIEIEIEADCGAITTKNFEFTEWQFNLGSTVLDFCCNNFNDEKLNCQRYYIKSYPDGVAPGSLTVAGGIATAYFNSVTTTGEIGQVIVLPITPRILNNTIITIYSPSNGSAGYLDRYLLGIGGTPSTVNVSSSWTNNRSFFVYSAGSADANHLRFHYVVDARPTIA